MNFRLGLSHLLRRLAGLVESLGRRAAARPDDEELSTEQALRDSEERLRLVRRATGLGMYEIDWVARRRYWSPELRALLRVPDDLDINTDTDLLERIVPDEMRAAFRDKLHGLARAGERRRLRGRAPHHPLRRLDRLDPAARQDLLRRGAGGAARHAFDRAGRRHHRPQARRGGERAARLDGAVLERCDLLDRSGADHPDLEPGAERLYGYSAAEAIGRPLTDHLSGRPARRACGPLRQDHRGRAGRDRDGAPAQGRPARSRSASAARRSSMPSIAWSASRRCIAT